MHYTFYLEVYLFSLSSGGSIFADGYGMQVEGSGRLMVPDFWGPFRENDKNPLRVDAQWM